MLILWQDIRYATRQRRMSPAFTITAVLTRGLGMGAAATIDAVVQDVLTAPLPYAAPSQLVGVHHCCAKNRRREVNND